VAEIEKGANRKPGKQPKVAKKEKNEEGRTRTRTGKRCRQKQNTEKDNQGENNKEITFKRK
jgi:hypothetical protein